jgi:translation initiation factor 2-alpha kinase 4
MPVFRSVRPGDLVAWLQHQIAEQKRVDLALGGGTGAPAATVATSGIIGDHGSSVSGGSIGGIQVIVAGGERGEQRKTQRHKLKTAFHEKGEFNPRNLSFGETYYSRSAAHLLESDLKSALQSNQCPTIAVDLPSTVLSTLANANPAWVTNDDTWKTITNEQKDNALQGLLLQVREVVSRKKLEGAKWTLLISVKDERVYVLKL